MGISMKQAKAIKLVVENHGNVSRAMIKAGYSPATAKNPKNLTETKAYKSIMDRLPDEILIKKHKQLLNKQEIVVISDGNGEGSHVEKTGQPHSDAVRALDMAYKLKGLYAPEKIQHGGGIIIVNDYEKEG